MLSPTAILAEINPVWVQAASYFNRSTAGITRIAKPEQIARPKRMPELCKVVGQLWKIGIISIAQV
jgi:hypothetical protein